MVFSVTIVQFGSILWSHDIFFPRTSWNAVSYVYLKKCKSKQLNKYHFNPPNQRRTVCRIRTSQHLLSQEAFSSSIPRPLVHSSWAFSEYLTPGSYIYGRVALLHTTCATNHANCLLHTLSSSRVGYRLAAN